jgi:hypothetical protein
MSIPSAVETSRNELTLEDQRYRITKLTKCDVVLSGCPEGGPVTYLSSWGIRKIIVYTKRIDPSWYMWWHCSKKVDGKERLKHHPCQNTSYCSKEWAISVNHFLLIRLSRLRIQHVKTASFINKWDATIFNKWDATISL